MSRRLDGARSAVRAAALDLGPLRRHPPFRSLWAGQAISTMGRQITVVALPYQLYSLTHSTIAVGALGLAQFVPLLAVSLVGGAAADRLDRRRVLLAANLLLATGSAVLAAAALADRASPALLYVVGASIAGLGGLEQPARSATVPRLVSRGDLPGALTLMFGTFVAAQVVGPALGGLLIGATGLGVAYLVDVASFGAAVVAVLRLPAQPPAPGPHERPLRSVATGLRFLGTRPEILGGFAIDVDAMVFGMPRALFPALAATTFHSGPQGLGLLYAAPGAGAMLALVAGGGVARTRRLGRVIVLSVAVWGAAIALAGLMHTLWPALVLLAVAGAGDSLSAVCRATMLQAGTPDHLRGRASAAYATVVIGGPYLGDLEAGVVGGIFSPAVSMVSGGLLCLGGAGVVLARFPQLWLHDSHDDLGTGRPAEETAPAPV